uniref:Coiled-coil domain-containing protein 85C n=1 Tax=Strigamia maritima TaxID=126957 RepID=T1JP62_STRMM
MVLVANDTMSMSSERNVSISGTKQQLSMQLSMQLSPPKPMCKSSSDHDLLKLGAADLVKKLRKAEADNIKLTIDHGAVMKEVNCRMQVHSMEIRATKDANQRLEEDNLELRDLCCFLDDDRQKGRKLAREWQRFGRYTASVMRQEVSAYQNKLRELESKQQELIKDNLELKQLCLYLDEERTVNRSTLCGQCGALLHGPRDEGDGSSSSTNTNDEPLALALAVALAPPPPPTRTCSRERLLEEGIQRQRSVINGILIRFIFY